ncbi:TetR family transcriptional regulator [Bacillus glycinifermentans]|uniref:TetR family transcriptional regulator n=1 Tax=Bacillus glycinifermentans TaxID=1664069 RepID=A0A0J6EQC2_9BACI|nr:TetR/AcrR family transcriptional regulator [Bacillus glycinifermentans]ATH94670.1 TetR/AcrR family transcriptional regulator [Bacillus glycinifermentans]KMM57271.1 TetR family transcriptional regulator [Bacillus glycinifermentans]KRT93591.1 TetR family transcriptional regulator [Bacillus glycinifermentans]MEC0486037.1 TetR/AcrR family transcriptional regulator [Bacillus glycinifermentans]MEC0496644.1 TetR/AcrR family transcriptional regulator [Bacillus glycinifermentans]
MLRRRLNQKERKEETRQMLLHSAVEIFSELGFHGASVEKIAEHAGFSKGAVYSNFKSKEELFLALLEQQMNLHVNNIDKIIDQQDSLAHFIEAMHEHFVSVTNENQKWIILNTEFLLHAMRNEPVRSKWSCMIMESVDQISKSVAKLMLKENHNSALSPEEIAWTIFSLENGLAIFNFINEEKVPANLYGKALKDMLLTPENPTDGHRNDSV